MRLFENLLCKNPWKLYQALYDPDSNLVANLNLSMVLSLFIAVSVMDTGSRSICRRRDRGSKRPEEIKLQRDILLAN